MDFLDTREWLLTNGLGSFASGTVSDAHTRTYHGWLFAAVSPPGLRTLLLSHIEAYLDIAGEGYPLGTNYWGSRAVSPVGYKLLQSFSIGPVPTWVWGTSSWTLTREILMTYGLLPGEADKSEPRLRHQVYVRYRYAGREPAWVNLRPLVGDRNFHHQQHTSPDAEPDLRFSQLVEPNRVSLQATRHNWVGTSWQLSWSQGDYYPGGAWYWDYWYPEETRRGLGDREDLYSPGHLAVLLYPGQSLVLEARVRITNPLRPFAPPTQETFETALQTEQARLRQTFAPMLKTSDRGRSPAVTFAAPHLDPADTVLAALLRASDQFIAHRASIGGPTVIAGYHWFSDWGRDTLIALPGLCLKTQRFDLARGLLESFGKYCQGGLIPNTFPDSGAHPVYNSIDAALWWVEILGLYLEASQDWDFLIQQYPVVRQIHKSFATGTSYNIRIDAMDGLVTWEHPGVALTWMDAVVNGEPATPRQGKCIEINALWYSALRWAERWATRLSDQGGNGDEPANYANHARRYAQQADQVKASLQKFWNGRQSYFHDLLEPSDSPNVQIRPNAVIALSLAHCGFSDLQGKKALVTVRDRLLTPYGLRSLDPGDPHYVGRYIGDPVHRDHAYHQGTVWSWLIGPFIRAWQRFYPGDPLPWDPQPLLDHFANQACLGSISEIFDGDPPHDPQGAIAQAWSVAELVRHWDDLGVGG
ncbi:MAG: amylo-alpha-1,6-glucosidase [Cyanobacteria bacterium J069]|nr:MAG: amylo-alpha-1,6-glucosidase [Cyanobacteria bacterium J069]